MSVGNVTARLSRLLGPGHTAHSLRHRFGTRAYAGAFDLRAVQELLGHASPATTARYVAVPSENLVNAVLAVPPVPGIQPLAGQVRHLPERAHEQSPTLSAEAP